ILRGASESEVLLGVNHRQKPFDNVLVRRAMAKAIDRQAVVGGAEFGYGKPIGAHFSTNHPAYVDTTGVNAYDPEAAKALLKEAGYPDGFEATFKVPPQGPFVRSAEIVAAYFEQVGIRLKIEKLQWPQWLEQVFRNRSFQITIIDHDAPMDFDVHANSNYFYGYDSEKYRMALQKVKEATTPEAQLQSLQAIQTLFAEELPVIPIYQMENISVAKKGLVGLWSNMPVYIANMTDVHWQD
ncbi:MAG: ABC transporter substrate-binding protein, partial [Parvibaculaceae bacterium]